MAEVPTNAAEYRFGGFVFTHRGVNIERVSPGVWLVVLPPQLPMTDEDAKIVVALTDGSVQRFPVSIFERRLFRQNQHRQWDQLPALILSDLLPGDSDTDSPPSDTQP